MSKVEEAWVDVTDTMILGDKRGWSQVEIESAVRAGFLVVHVDVCQKHGPVRDGYETGTGRGEYMRCGDGWYCDVAEEIKKLGL